MRMTVRQAARSVSFLLSAFMLAACGQGTSSSAQAAQPRLAAEVIVRTPANLHNGADVAAFVQVAARNGIEVISVLVKQDEDAAVPSGQVYYASKLAPIAVGYAGFDVLQAVIAAAHPLGIKVRAWMPQFHDQAAATAHPSWQMMAAVGGQAVPYTGAHSTEFFVNPLDPAVQQYELSLVKEVADNYAVDGIMLDWLRFDNYDMDVGNVTRQAYMAATGVDPLSIDFSQAGAVRDRWNGFRTDGIAAYVRTLRAALPASLPIGVYILPPEFVEVAQDAAKFNSQVAVLAPMCYFRDWGFTLDWVWNNCLATTAAKAGGSTVVPTMDSNLSDDQYRQIMAHVRHDYPRVTMLSWFWHEQWTEARLARVAAISTW
jgi:hypothetical protein